MTRVEGGRAGGVPSYAWPGVGCTAGMRVAAFSPLALGKQKPTARSHARFVVWGARLGARSLSHPYLEKLLHGCHLQLGLHLVHDLVLRHFRAAGAGGVHDGGREGVSFG